MSNFIPRIGMKGVYTLNAPFNSILVTNVPYVCAAIRSIPDIIAGGDDPLALYYTPNGLSQTILEADIQNGVSIVTLMSDAGDVQYVPTSFMTTFPDIGGIPYVTVILAMNIGAIPDSTNLSYIKSKLEDDVLEIIGIKTTVELVIASEPTIVTAEQDAAITAARAAITGNVQTDYAQLLATQSKLTMALERIGMLQNYILGKPSPPLPPYVTITSIEASGNGSMTIFNQSVTLNANTTVGSIQAIQYSLDTGNTWNNFAITPAQSITGTYPLTLPIGESTILLRATDSNSVTSAIENLIVVVNAVNVTWIPNAVTGGSTINITNGPANTAITLAGTYAPSGTVIPPTPIGTTDANGNLQAVMAALSWGSDTYINYSFLTPGNVDLGSGIFTPAGIVAVPPTAPPASPVTVNLNSSTQDFIVPAGVTELTAITGNGSPGTVSVPGIAASAFGELFPGGNGGVVSPVTFNNISVIPGNDYPTIIPAGGTIAVTYTPSLPLKTLTKAVLSTANATWTAPPGVTNVLAATGNGAAATPVYTLETNTWTINPAIVINLGQQNTEPGLNVIATPTNGIPTLGGPSATTVVTPPSIVYTATNVYGFVTPTPAEVTITGVIPAGTYTVAASGPPVNVTNPDVTAYPSYSVTIDGNNTVTAVTQIGTGLATVAYAQVACNYGGVGTGNPTITFNVVSSNVVNTNGSVTISGGQFISTTTTASATLLVNSGYQPLTLTAAGSAQVITGYTAGAAATVLGETFPGATGASQQAVTFNNIAVVPGTVYPVAIPAGGSVTLKYLE